MVVVNACWVKWWLHSFDDCQETFPIVCSAGTFGSHAVAWHSKLPDVSGHLPNVLGLSNTT